MGKFLIQTSLIKTAIGIGKPLRTYPHGALWQAVNAMTSWCASYYSVQIQIYGQKLNVEYLQIASSTFVHHNDCQTHLATRANKAFPAFQTIWN